MRGFTLIEVLLYISLYGLLMTGVLHSLSAIRESVGRTDAQAQLLAEGVPLLQTLERYASNSDDLSIFYLDADALIQLRDGTEIRISDSSVRVRDFLLDQTDPSYSLLHFSLARSTEDGKLVQRVFTGMAYRTNHE